MKQKFLAEVSALFSKLESRPKGKDQALQKNKRLAGFFKEKENFYNKSLLISEEKLKKTAFNLGVLYDDNPANEKAILEILHLVSGKNILKNLDQLKELGTSLTQKTKSTGAIKLKAPGKLPAQIREDVVADINELEKSFNQKCYRAAVILCGRLIETALHRKYYEATGHDVLEKSPGIGLGKLIAKLSEKKIKLEPGLSQQVHLINQVRVFSVHKKQDAFYPSRNQAMGIILFTTDIIEKLFG